MKKQRMHGWTGVVGVVLLLLWTLPVSAQTFSSGSTGADGAFAPTGNTTVPLPPDGVLNFTTVNIPAGVTVTFAPNAANTPVTMLATGDVTIAGTISVNGAPGVVGGSPSPLFNPGGLGGPGGYNGGQSGSLGLTNNGGSAGQGPGGGAPGTSNGSAGTYGPSGSFVSLLPLFGGSGGGGTNGFSTTNGSSAGGGGGAIVIASTTKITVTGVVGANGGSAAFFGCGFNGCAAVAGAGSGGAIRLVAPQITSSGTLSAQGGFGGGGDGRIRLEAFVFGTVSASTTPTPSIVLAPGPITANSTPALIKLPALTISSVGGVANAATPGGSYTAADVSLPTGTSNPVTVTLTASNIPLGTAVTVKLIPQFAAAATVSASGLAGTDASSTATASVTFPPGVFSVLNAFASFQALAGMFPLIDGEEVDRVLVAAEWGKPSRVTLITRSGKEVQADQLWPSLR